MCVKHKRARVPPAEAHRGAQFWVRSERKCRHSAREKSWKLKLTWIMIIASQHSFIRANLTVLWYQLMREQSRALTGIKSVHIRSLLLDTINTTLNIHAHRCIAISPSLELLSPIRSSWQADRIYFKQRQARAQQQWKKQHIACQHHTKW